MVLSTQINRVFFFFRNDMLNKRKLLMPFFLFIMFFFIVKTMTIWLMTQRKWKFVDFVSKLKGRK